MGRRPEKGQDLSRAVPSDAAWLAMTAVDHDEDRWNDIEEHLLRPQHHEKRWKYFAK